MLILATPGKSNPLAQTLNEQLWPKISECAPAVAVVQGVAWAFGSAEANAIVIEALNAEGVRTAERLTDLPTDFLTQSVRATRSRLLSEFHLGGTPGTVSETGLTQTGLAIAKASPQPFRISFGDSRPPAVAEAVPQSVSPEVPLAVPGFAAPKQLIPMLRFKDDYLTASHSRAWSQDLRFSDATDLEIEVSQAGPVDISVDGIFRYSDRRPATQPQWEDYLVLWDQYLKAPRQPAAFKVFVDGQPAGQLDKITEEKREVALNIVMASTGEPSRKAEEEVATQISGQVELPAGRHRLRLVHTNIVDGVLNRVRVGLDRAQAEAQEAEIKAAEAAAKKVPK